MQARIPPCQEPLIFHSVVMLNSTVRASKWESEDELFFREAYEKIHSAQQRIVSSDGIDAEVFLNAWNSALVHCDAVSFDVFDTALLRACLQPDHVFLFLKDFEPFHSLPLDIGQIYLRRIRAEQAARDILWNSEKSVETTLAEIYAQFCRAENIADPAPFAEAEQRVELALAEASKPIFDLYQQARNTGKKILFFSDTFFEKSFLKKLLAQCGYDVHENEIFASCEYRKGKYEGDLFLIACKQHGIDPRKLLHIGDNPKSDVDGALRANCKALLHPHAFSHTQKQTTGDYRLQKTESILQGIAYVKNQSADPWFQFGHRFFGPLLSGFVLWLIQKFKEDGIQKAFFLLRDGLILSKIYEILRSENSPSFQLLHSSRRAFGIAALGCSLMTDTEFLIVSANPRPAKEFLTRLNIDASKFEDVFKECGFQSSEEIVDHRDKPDKVLALLRHPAVLAALNQRALVERKLLMRYLEQIEFFTENKTAIVDVGWNCTVQKSLAAILVQEEKKTDCMGYYLGTFPRAQDGDGYVYKSYCCHNGDPHFIAETIASCRELFEIVCSSFDGSLRHFNKSEGQIVPVLDAYEISQDQQNILRAIHDGILAFATALKNHAFCPDSLPSELAIASLCRLIEQPSPEEAERIGSLEIGDGLGSQTKKHLAAFTDKNCTQLDKLLLDYQNAYWKQGLLTQDCLSAWTLKTVLRKS
ncbi:MAG: HAD family hydrolase [Verrucomicrobiota bacterium]